MIDFVTVFCDIQDSESDVDLHHYDPATAPTPRPTSTAAAAAPAAALAAVLAAPLASSASPQRKASAPAVLGGEITRSSESRKHANFTAAAAALREAEAEVEAEVEAQVEAQVEAEQTTANSPDKTGRRPSKFNKFAPTTAVVLPSGAKGGDTLSMKGPDGAPVIGELVG